MLSNESCFNALEAFAKAFSKYLKVNGRRTYEIASITGQESVKVSIRALYRVHDPSYGFSRVYDVIMKLFECDLIKSLSSLGINLKIIGNEVYMIIKLNKLKELVFMSEDEVKKKVTSIIKLSDESHAL